MITRFVIVMGVAGCGKTTVGKSLAIHLGWDFYDADHFHPPESIAKMTNGMPLNDADRSPWIASLHILISSSLIQNRPSVLACLALKESYRQQILGAVGYVNLLAENLEGIRNRIPYFKELGTTYLYIMPLFKAPERENEGQSSMRAPLSQLSLSARAYHRTQTAKLARRIADFAGIEEIESAHLAWASFAVVLS